MGDLNLDLDLNADENFFGQLKGRSNLGQLFGIDVQGDSADDDRHSLKYQRTKATNPRNTIQQQANDQAGDANSDRQTDPWNTVWAKVVKAFKAGTLVGKVGVALLQNQFGNCKLILYKSKTDVLATVTIQQTTSDSLHQQNHYLQFYDDVGIYWSLLFINEEDEKEFFAQLKVLNIPVQLQEQKYDEITMINTEQSIPLVGPSSLPVTKKPTGAHAKSTLITRMAKMGQQLPFPNSTALSTEYSDSSDTEVLVTPLQREQRPTVAPRMIVPLYNRNANVESIIVQPSQLQANNTHAGMETQFMHMMLTDNRTQNTELRMNLNKLESKIERVLDKIDSVRINGIGQQQPQQQEQRHRDDEILELEEKILLLKKENRRLKQSFEAMNFNNGTKNDRESFEEMKRNLIFRHRQDLEDLLGLESDQDLESIITSLLLKIKTLQNKITLNESLTVSTNADLIKIHEELRDERALLTAARQLNVDYEKTSTQLQNKLSDLQKEFDAMKLQNDQHDYATTEKVKTIMNNLYSSMTLRLEEQSESCSLNSQSVLTLLGRTIRDETLKTLAQK